ncbi:hypothetical protein EG329_012015 [Mollisiaceae sp. DMI_Dod_QoI]|nr:hypothetical protein EG329_012015 [Helotiales sp. DMI_Dod_QoI]
MTTRETIRMSVADLDQIMANSLEETLFDRSKCAVCNKIETDSIKLQLCARCKKSKYCSKECQAEDWPSHKTSCKADNYILKINLCPEAIQNPAVSRTLSCPANSTFEQLHDAIQTAFDWAGTHAYDFKIKDPNALPEPVFDIMAHIQRRQVEDNARNRGQPIPDFGPRQNLLRIIDADMYGVDIIHNDDRKHSQTPEVKSTNIKLSKVFDNKDYKGAGIEYEYDFGDCWTHEIEILGRAPATGNFVCTDGEGHGVAEDVGSPSGWLKLREAYKAARPTGDQKELMRWFEAQASNADSKGLKNGRDRIWDKDAINADLSS